MFAADEIAHRATPLSEEDKFRFFSHASFVGTWMPERGAFLLRLIDRGVPLTIFGPRWEKAPEFPLLKDHVRLGSLSSEEYVKAIQCTSIAIGLLSKGNQDLHTTRSIEIPAIGTLLCAERTAEHLAMYSEGEEAVFWDDADECASTCLDLLADQERLRRISKAGNARALRNGHFNENLIASVLRQIGDIVVSSNISRTVC
ncbi:glycosyltransferase family 1 protein [Bradyrhizobium sp. BRP19]|uniref:CgeB family protein n=1 Tax=Bradyrhizobium sp. BRP19 TaxID=2793823 RepID=UPI001CD1E742|nr:glycosyltransferase [Bradyrhizobium sp. BRP19]MCA1550698.1 glycosyltransferase family 1 protein [Bradyrhizobium sp. BRP19]